MSARHFPSQDRCVASCSRRALEPPCRSTAHFQQCTVLPVPTSEQWHHRFRSTAEQAFDRNSQFIGSGIKRGCMDGAVKRRKRNSLSRTYSIMYWNSAWHNVPRIPWYKLGRVALAGFVALRGGFPRASRGQFVFCIRKTESLAAVCPVVYACANTNTVGGSGSFD